MAGSLVRECSLLLLASPAGSGYGPVTSPISPSLRMADVPGPPSRMATMDQYLPRELMDIPLLPRPLTPCPIVEGLVTGSTVGSSVREPVAVHSQCMPDLSREGPFDVHLNASESGASPRVLDSLPGCQYRMTTRRRRRTTIQTSAGRTAFIYMIHGCSNMWGRLSRLVYSVVLWNTGCITWDVRELWWLRCSYSTTRA